MSIEVKINGDNSGFKKSIDDSVNRAKKAGKEITKATAPKLGDRIKQGTEGISKGFGAVGMGAGQIGNIGDVAKVGPLAIIAAGVASAYKLASAYLKGSNEGIKNNVETEERNLEQVEKLVALRDKERQKIEETGKKLADLAQKQKLTNEEQIQAQKLINDLKGQGVTGNFGVDGNKVVGGENIEKAIASKNYASKKADLELQEKSLKEQLRLQKEVAGKTGYFRDVSDTFFGTTNIQDANQAAEKQLQILEKMGAIQKEKRGLDKDYKDKFGGDETQQKKRLDQEKALLDAKLEDVKEQEKEKQKKAEYDSATDAEKLLIIDKEIADEKAKIAKEEERIAKDKKHLQDHPEDADYLGNKRLAVDIAKEELELEKRKQAMQDKEIEKQKILNQQSKNFKNYMKDAIRSLELSSLEKYGNKKEADKQKALDDAKKAKGADLTDAEKEQVNKISDLRYQLENQPKLNLSGLDIKTNELTSRGGFAGGVVAPDVDRVNNQIANYAKRQADLLTQIKSQIDKLKEY